MTCLVSIFESGQALSARVFVWTLRVVQKAGNRRFAGRSQTGGATQLHQKRKARNREPLRIDGPGKVATRRSCRKTCNALRTVPDENSTQRGEPLRCKDMIQAALSTFRTSASNVCRRSAQRGPARKSAAVFTLQCERFRNQGREACSQVLLNSELNRSLPPAGIRARMHPMRESQPLLPPP